VGHAGSPFAWLEALSPPLLVLSTASVPKEQLLEAIEHRHTTERTYQAASSEWHRATAHPETHPQWSQLYANALRDALSRQTTAPPGNPGCSDDCRWRVLVYRELQTEHWYLGSEGDYIVSRPVQELDSVPLAVRAKRNGNGVHASAGAV
jgi:hypothetical protein